MSRKDIMKKSLGIPEYPWSSDDELDDVMAPVEASTRRPTSEPRPSVAESPGTSSNGGSTNPAPPRPQSGNQQPGTQTSRNQPSRTHQSGTQSSRSQQSGTPQQSGSRLSGNQQSGSRLSGSQPHEARRNQERIDEDLYWTILNAPHIVNSSTGSREPYNELPAFLSRVSHTPAQELRERGERPTVSDMQRILAFKRLTRNLASTSLRRGPVTGLIPVSRVNPGIVVPSEATSSIRIGRMVPRRRYYRSPPSGSGSGSARTGGSLSPRSSRSRREHEPSSSRPSLPMDEGEAQRPTIPAQNIADEANPDQEENLEGLARSLETSADTISLGEPELEGSAADISDPQDVAPGEDGPVTEEPSPSVEYPAPVTDPNLASVSQTTEADLPPPPTTYPAAKRKRRDSEDNTEPSTVKEYNQSLLRLLECPVCLEWMEPPMSQCRRGHLVCGRCRARLNCCPVCRTAFSSVRNRAMEGVAEMVRYPCRHGCGREVRLRRRAPHEASCVARKYLCPAPLCANSHPLPRTDLHVHFQSPNQEPGETSQNEGLSERKDAEDEKTLLYPDIRKGESILQQLLSGRGTSDRLTRNLLIRRSFVAEELTRQLVAGLPGGRPPPEHENSAPLNRPLGPGRPYLEALRRLAVNIANEPGGAAGPAQANPANPGAPAYFPPARPPPFPRGHVAPRNPPLNAGPNYFLGMPGYPLPLGIRHSAPVGRQNIFLPDPHRPDAHHHGNGAGNGASNGASNGTGNGAGNGAESKHLPMIKIGRLHKFSMKVNIEQHDNWLIFAMDEYFHLRIDVDIRTWGVVVYVSYIGPKCDAKNFTYSVTVDGQHNSRKITYTRATHSDLESSSLNVTRQDCFHLTLDQALNFIRFKNRHCDTDKFLDFNLEIAKVEPTTPRDESDS